MVIGYKGRGNRDQQSHRQTSVANMVWELQPQGHNRVTILLKSNKVHIFGMF